MELDLYMWLTYRAIRSMRRPAGARLLGGSGTPVWSRLRRDPHVPLQLPARPEEGAPALSRHPPEDLPPGTPAPPLSSPCRPGQKALARGWARFGLLIRRA